MSCTRVTQTNNSESLLFNKLMEIHSDENVAEREYRYFKSNLFKKRFGDFETNFGDVSFENRVDENGEPLLEKSDEGNYRLIDLEGNEVFYPFNKNGLKGVFDYKEIESLSDSLLLDYINSKDVAIDFDNIDLKNLGTLESIEKYVVKRLKSISNALNESGDIQSMINASRIDKALEYPKEIVTAVKNSLLRKNLKVKLSEETYEEVPSDFDDIDQDSEKPRELIRKNSIERDSKENLSSNIKLKLSLLVHPTETDLITGLPSLIPFNDVYNVLRSELSNTVAITDENGNREDMFVLMQNKVRDMVKSYKPHYSILEDKMNKMSKSDQREFVQAFNLHGNNLLTDNFRITNTDEGKAVVTSTRNVSKSGSKRNLILDTWQSNFHKKFINNDGSIKIQTDTLLGQMPLPELLNKLSTMLWETSQNFNDTPVEDIVKRFKGVMDTLGAHMSEQGFNRYMSKNSTSLLGEAETRQLLNETFFKLIKGVKQISKQVDKDLSEGTVDSNVNYFRLSENIFSNIAEAHSLFVKDVSDSTVQFGGKQIWLFSYPSYISSRVLEWKKDRKILEDLYNSSAYNKSSALMKWLLNIEDENEDSFDTELTEQKRIEVSKQRINAFDIGIYMNMAVNVDGQNNVSELSDIAFKDYYTSHVNKVLRNDYVRTTTPAEKGTDLQIKTGFRVKTSTRDSFDGKRLDVKTLDVMLGYFNGEFQRMIEAYQEYNDPSVQKRIFYHEDAKGNKGNAFKSQLFSELSYGSVSKDPLVNEIKSRIYSDTGIPLDLNGESLTSDSESMMELKQMLHTYINNILIQGIENTKNNMIAQEILKMNNDGIILNNNIDSNLFFEYRNNVDVLTSDQLQITQLAIDNIVSDVYINGLIQNIEYSKMFTGDVAYYKSMVDYKKRVPATYTDGLQLYLDSGDELANISIISSVKVASPFLKELRDMYEELSPGDGYKADNNYGDGEINSADAQAWITPERWEFLVRRLGKWSKTHDSLYVKMIQDTPQTYTEKELKIAAQPLKGVYFYINNGVPVYLKYSQAVLTGNLIKNQELGRIYDKMTKDENGKKLPYNEQLHELVTLDGIKVGAILPSQIHDKNGNLKDDFKLNKMVIHNAGWKLQQDLPVKGFKDTEVGSQIQKNVYAGLLFNKDKDFTFRGRTVKGADIIREIVNTTGDLSDIGLQELFESLGIDTATGKINNSRKMYQTMIDDLIKTNGSTNVIQALQKGLPIPLIPQAVNKLKNLFTSKVNNKVVKIKTNGGSFIQMSNFGISYEEGSDYGVKFAPWADRKTNEPFIQRINEDGKIVLKPAGVLLSGSFLSKHIPDWASKSTEELFGKLNDETGKYEGGLIDEDILSNIIGYRIPNQGLSSNDALRVVGIIPESNGDTVVAYTGITKKTGSDKISLFEPV